MSVVGLSGVCEVGRRSHQKKVLLTIKSII